MDVGSIFLAAIGIGLLIFLHEAGHFLAARLAGVRVEVFSLGFGPRLFGRVLGGTDFRVSLVPFGGYVMVAGQDPSDRRYPREQSLWAKGAGQRALFWSGGVLMNVLFALLVFPLVFGAGVQFDAPVVGQVEPGSAAWEAGIEPGERVLSVGGKEIYSFDLLAVEVALAGGRPVTLELQRGDEAARVVTATPKFDPGAGLYVLGIRPSLAPEPPELQVVAGGPAAAAGLRTGDRLQSIDGQPPQAWHTEALAPVAVEVTRGGERVTARVAPTPTSDGVPFRIGVEGLPRVVLGLRPGSELVEGLGLRPGDVVLAIDGHAFVTGDLAVQTDGPPRTRWLVERDGQVVSLEADAPPAARAALPAHVALRSQPEQVFVRPRADSPAAAAGVEPGDLVVRVDDTGIETWDDLVDAVGDAGARPLRLVVRRHGTDAPPDALRGADAASGQLVELRLTPAQQPLPDFGWNYGLSPLQDEIRATGVGDAIRLGVVCSLDLVKQLYVTLKRLLTGDVAAKNLGGIIRISQVSYYAAQRGPSWFWYFLALLSVNLAFVNLLPIPVLDGGHLLFLLIEKVKGSPVSTRVLGYSQIVGLVFVLLLVLFVTYNDILRLL